GHEADDLANVEALSADVLAENLAGARVDGDKPEQRADHRRLPSPIRAEQTDYPLGRLDRKSVQGRDLAVGFGDVVKLEEHSTFPISEEQRSRTDNCYSDPHAES